MPKVLFWNVARRSLIKELASIVVRDDPDIIILSESTIGDRIILDAINREGFSRYYADLNVSTRIKIYSKFETERMHPVLDDEYFSIRKVLPYLGPQLILCAVHMPSKLHATNLDQFVAAQKLSKAIREIEDDTKIFHTFAIGDFNMSPFEDGMVGASALHAVLSRKVALRKSRIVKKKRYSFFYNPMWGLMGDLTEGPPGTHQYSKAVEINYFWHTYDQVILRPDLLACFQKDDLTILEEVGSDHYPIFVNIRSEVLL